MFIQHIEHWQLCLLSSMSVLGCGWEMARPETREKLLSGTPCPVHAPSALPKPTEPVGSRGGLLAIPTIHEPESYS